MPTAAERLHRISADVYEEMARNGLLPERGVELIDGLVVTMSPKGDRYHFAVNCLTKHLVLQARDRYEVNADSLSLRLSANDKLEPDLALTRATRSYARERPSPGEIALIVEVADTSLAFDLGEKNAKYAGAGIPEYWVVDLQGSAIHVFGDPRGNGYVARHAAKAGEALSPAEYPDVAIDVALVLGETQRLPKPAVDAVASRRGNVWPSDAGFALYANS